MIKILKASAGAGKTYNLSKTYISLLKERYAYRHILAVTFTNKATSEMKSRILSDLAADPSKKDMLTDILHDYGAFAVSTIDRFFQQALKAFSRETGHFSSYQIELDRNLLISEAVDRLLDSLTEDSTEVISWLRDSLTSRLERGDKVSMEDSLVQMGKLLKGDEYRELKERLGIDDSVACSKERLSRVDRECHEILKAFPEKVNKAAKDIEGQIVSKKASELLVKYLGELKPGAEIEKPKITLAKEAAGTEFMKLFEGDDYKAYNTARIVRESTMALGLAREFFREFDALLKEKNLMSLDESNTILRDIIDGSDAPFVYEKLGVRYENFLLDEFQDTSNIQWSNFRPLLKESEASNHFNLVVGDVKQSIYRFRDSDWRLLAEKLHEDFPDAETEPLENNWRSCRNIVEFNNSFFKYAASQLGESDLYSDVIQGVKSSDPQAGQVKIDFCDKGDIGDRILASVRAAIDQGARLSDIAILVKENREGQEIGSLLISEGYDVISDESLKLSSCLAVRNLVSLLSCIDNPEDRLGSYLAESLGVDTDVKCHSLVDLCEVLLRALREKYPSIFEGSSLFVNAFLDDVQNWTLTNGGDLHAYLRHWQDSDLSIASPEGSDSIRILTIHKSKGLEFPYLIFPYAEKVAFYKADIHWCHLDTARTPFSAEMDGIYPINLSGKVEDSFFAADLERERRMQLIDNLNVFYVALTRAKNTLHVISASPSKSFMEAKEKTCNKFSDLLYLFCGQTNEYSKGEKYDFSVSERKKQEMEDYQAGFVSIPPAGRLTASADASDFFSDDGKTGTGASARRSGIILHDILAHVQEKEDLRRAVDEAVLDGQLESSLAAETFEMLDSRIQAHPEWFSAPGRNELPVIAPDGSVWRPDRVVSGDDGTLVIDYKFGERDDERYSRQVGRYCRLYSRMGYKNVRGVIWYVRDDIKVEVNI